MGTFLSRKNEAQISMILRQVVLLNETSIFLRKSFKTFRHFLAVIKKSNLLKQANTVHKLTL